MLRAAPQWAPGSLTACCAQAVRQPLPTVKDLQTHPCAPRQLFFYSMQYDHTRNLHFEDCRLPEDGPLPGPARWRVRTDVHCWPALVQCL